MTGSPSLRGGDAPKVEMSWYINPYPSGYGSAKIEASHADVAWWQ